MNQKYVAPARGKEAFTCPHCYTLSLMIHKHHYHDEGNTVIVQKGPYSGYLNGLFITRCVNYGKRIVWISGGYIYPDIIAEEPNLDMPQSVMQLYNEAGTIYNKSPRTACVLLRLAIDRLCSELGETGRDINRDIGSLVERGLPQSVQQALDVVRVVGNKAVRPGAISFDVDDKRTTTMLMRLLNVITERMITEPKEIKSLYEESPETVKGFITKRGK